MTNNKNILYYFISEYSRSVYFYIANKTQRDRVLIVRNAVNNGTRIHINIKNGNYEQKFKFVTL